MSAGPAAAGTDAAGTESPAARPRRWPNTVSATMGAATGLLPHLLHHVGLFAGTAILVGAPGTALFGLLGVIAMVPMLIRLRRRFSTWWAPAIALVVFAVMFAVSALVLGPALRGAGPEPSTPGPGSSTPEVPHTDHHR